MKVQHTNSTTASAGCADPLNDSWQRRQHTEMRYTQGFGSPSVFQGTTHFLLVQAVLIPSVTVGGGDSMPGCFTHEGGVTITKGQLFLWELIMTFVLVSTVYAVAVTKPGHGNIGPLAVGFSLFASAFIGKYSVVATLYMPSWNS